MSRIFTIALDAMSGDIGPEAIVPAALNALKKYDDIALILVGDEAGLNAVLSGLGGGVGERLSVHHCTQVVDMDEPPAQALRGKKDSSMRVAINLVKDGLADACVSSGNTGALMATARYVLKTLPGIDRPAICTTMPSLTGHTHMLDLGANVDCTAEHLHQFAVMGSVLAEAVDVGSALRVGLLNVGSEAIKGNDQVKEAARLLESSSLNYIGYVEGDDIYTGEVDIVVCDGFVGNVALKTSEGVAKMISHLIRVEFKKNIFTYIAAVFAKPVLDAFRRNIDPRRYNGASFLGLQGIVVKSHGGADALAFENAIKIARVEVQADVPNRIDTRLDQLLNQKRND